ncbi:MAG: O-methyltransferase [Fimbriimonadaceae bacterium]|nr:putative O-methyltransferase [Fimbriimonadaceae bacterium]QOJ11335.1 MAG: O-methyltransferase [Chthonomonadaceae bacterium]RIJ97601.1 MAG: O-methyltransferase [Armatimonadota bacterium]MCC6351728.1 O-methyltransferase [Fimbriimonadaceae bacterium]MCL4283588.1 O-methyltransferase [Fimbriimonadaceae bacterium]
MAELHHPDLRSYLDSLVPKRPRELQIMEEYAREHGFPIVGPASGQFCYLQARLIGAKRVFELGSGYGYSTAWFCRAVRENGGGEVHHVVWDKDLSNRARRHLDSLGYGDIVRFTVGEAVTALSHAEGSFDLIFNDIEKEAYPASLPVIAEKLRSGGLLIVDNLLWSGRVFDPSDTEASTQAIREFTRLVVNDPGWVASLVPIRDGLLVAQKA